MRFCKPAAVFIVGSYIQKNSSKLPLTIDMTLQLEDVHFSPPSHPQRCFSSRDISNWKYENKRSLYLSQLALELHQAFPKCALHYEWLHGDFDKPVLLMSIHILALPTQPPSLHPPPSVPATASSASFLFPQKPCSSWSRWHSHVVSSTSRLTRRRSPAPGSTTARCWRTF